MSKLSDLVSAVEVLEDAKARLYFVTRKLKPGLKKSSKAIDKYSYHCWTIHTDVDIQTELFGVFKEKLDFISDDKKFQVTDYTIVSDDSEKKVLTYSKKAKLNSFMHIVDDDIKKASTLPVVENLEEISGDLWAYVIEVHVDHRSICGLRKMAPSKILLGKKGLFTLFSTKDKSLTIFKEQTISFDRNIDVLYFDDVFYAISKDNFEEIVGLQEEYKEEARSVADRIENSQYIEMSYNLSGAIEEKPSFVRKLAKIRDEIEKLDHERIVKMKQIADQYHLQFSLSSSGKIEIRNDADLDVMIKLLDDYYLESIQTGKHYGAPVKTELKGA